MASLNQLISEMAHAVKQPNSIPVRRAIRLGIIHARNEAIRQSFARHGYTDKVLQQRFKVSLIDVPDGDLYESGDLGLSTVKRSRQQVPRPTRIDHNLPFHSVRTVGMRNPIEIAFAKEAVAKYYGSLPGFCPNITYDYINEYIYLNIPKGSSLGGLGAIIVESVFERPHRIPTETVEDRKNIDEIDDDDEFLLPEDMINTVKKLFFETFYPQIVRQTNEVPSESIIS